MLYKDYLQKHKSSLFNALLIKDKLTNTVQRTFANKMFDLLIEQMKEKEGITEELEEQD